MDESIRDTEIIHEIIPKFNFIYELGMPTGKKLKSTLFLILIFIVGYIAYLSLGDKLVNQNMPSNIDINGIINIVLLIGIAVTVIKLIIHIVFQNMQYKNIKYVFYNNHMTYEDNFLNQHKKNIEYANIKEVEIRRSVWDRILGYGIIVIYTNAENEYSNGLVIFGIKNPKYHYDIIDNLVHSPRDVESNTKKEEIEEVQEEPNEDSVENVEQTHEEFLESLKHIEK